MRRHRIYGSRADSKGQSRIPKAIAFSSAIFFILFVAAVSLKTMLQNMAYFNVKDIIVRENNAVESLHGPRLMQGKDAVAGLTYLKGRNLFRLEAQRESAYISELHPSYRKIKMTKIFPDRLFIDFSVRRGLAYVRLSRYFCIDEDLVLFNSPDQSAVSDLPIITGLENKILNPKVGRPYAIREVFIALNIIKEVKTNRDFKDFEIKKIDVGNLESISFFLLREVRMQNPPAVASVPLLQLFEVKIGPSNLKEKVGILGSLLTQTKNFDTIKYIDLRFKDPVIKLKDAR